MDDSISDSMYRDDTNSPVADVRFQTPIEFDHLVAIFSHSILFQ